MSLRNRLILTSLSVTLPIIAALVIFFASSAAQLKKDIIDDLMADVATTLADSAARWDGYMQAVLENLSSQPDIISMDPARQREALRRMNRVFDRLDFIQVTAITGQATARSDDFRLLNYSDRRWFKLIQKTREPAHDVVVSRVDGSITAILASPVFDRDRLVGMVVAGIRLSKLSNEIGSQQLGRSGHTYIVDQYGTVICHPDGDMVNKITSLADHEPVRSVLAGKIGPFKQSNIQGNAKSIYAVRLANGWSVITEKNQKEIDTEIQHVWKVAGGIALTAGLIIIALQWIMANNIVKPINQIRQAANDLADGKWETRVPARHKDEVGALAESFNRMTDELKRSYQSVEDKVNSAHPNWLAATRNSRSHGRPRKMPIARKMIS